jgi:hypothetical protein
VPNRSGGLFPVFGLKRSVSDQHVIEPTVLGTETEQLPDLAGYLNFAIRLQWLIVTFRHEIYCHNVALVSLVMARMQRLTSVSHFPCRFNPAHS